MIGKMNLFSYAVLVEWALSRMSLAIATNAAASAPAVATKELDNRS